MAKTRRQGKPGADPGNKSVAGSRRREVLYAVQVWIPAIPEQELEQHGRPSWKEAMHEMEEMEFLQPENIYRIVDLSAKDEGSKRPGAGKRSRGQR